MTLNGIDEPGHVDLLVKKYPEGKTSTYLHSLQPGDKVLFWKVPGGYQWAPNQHQRVLLIAGGAGITPVYQLAQGILTNPSDKTSITLVFGVNTDADLLFKDEFKKFEQMHPGRFKAIYVVSHPNNSSNSRKGRVSESLLRETMNDTDEQPTKVFVCGPPGMETSLLGGRSEVGILGQLGFQKEQIYKF
ncbi:Nn.00g070510.m01.CDS01 [Neocucurbitaria sp. VM-36]